MSENCGHEKLLGYNIWNAERGGLDIAIQIAVEQYDSGWRDLFVHVLKDEESQCALLRSADSSNHCKWERMEKEPK